MFTVTVELEQVGVVCHALAEDGKSGNVAWFYSPSLLPEGTGIFIVPPKSISPHPIQDKSDQQIAP